MNLEVGLVYYWQQGGWHGADIITRISKRFVWIKGYPINPNEKEVRKSKKDMLSNKYVYYQFTTFGRGDYVHYYENIGTIQPIN